MATSTGRGSGHSPTNITKNLKGIDFPAGKKDLLKHAQQLKAEQVVIDEIQKMEDREYGNMADVMKSFGKELRESSSKSSISRKTPQAGQAAHGRSHVKPSHR